MKIGNDYPWVEFDFGRNVHFHLSDLAFEMPIVDSWKAPRPFPGRLLVTVVGNGGTYEFARTDEPMIVAPPSVGCAVRLAMIGETSNGGWVFRFSFVRICGSFVG
jgi:hypothetical protein